jgi:hypothetical protein
MRGSTAKRSNTWYAATTEHASQKRPEMKTWTAERLEVEP